MTCTKGDESNQQQDDSKAIADSILEGTIRIQDRITLVSMLKYFQLVLKKDRNFINQRLVNIHRRHSLVGIQEFW